MNAQASFVISKEVCPFCKARQLCSFHSTYKRDMIVAQNNTVVCHKLTISRLICSSCGHTHE